MSDPDENYQHNMQYEGDETSPRVTGPLNNAAVGATADSLVNMLPLPCGHGVQPVLAPTPMMSTIAPSLRASSPISLVASQSLLTSTPTSYMSQSHMLSVSTSLAPFSGPTLLEDASVTKAFPEPQCPLVSESNMLSKQDMLFQTHGIPCRHIIYVLRSTKMNQLPSHYLLRRWTKNCKKEIVYDADGNLLEEKEGSPVDSEVKRMASEMRKEMEEILQQACGSIDTMSVVRSKFQNFVTEVKQELPDTQRSRIEEVEGFIGCNIPSRVDILPPNDLCSRGSVKRIRGHFDKGGGVRKEESKKRKNDRIPRMCGHCKELVLHDKRNCPKKNL